jgi:hypothetical protein
MEDTMSEQRSCSGRLAIFALGATAMLCLLVSDASAGMKVKKPLQPTVVNPDATGQATALIKGQGNTRKGKLRVNGLKLSPHTEYTVRLAGVPIGTLTTDAAGNGKAKFSTRPGPLEQPLGTDPFGKTVEVENDQGEDELDADLPDEPLDPADIQCCVADGEETECEEMTADECTAANGTNLGAGSCVPDPCATDGEDIVCCLPGADGAECEETDTGDCSQAGGVSLGAGSCDPNPCATVPPADVIRCCVVDDDGEQECEELTADHCTAENGTNIGAGSCGEPNPCAAVP